MYSPPFRPPTAEEIAYQDALIRQSDADIVWVGLGTPKQDIETARVALSTSRTAVAVGAAFDFAPCASHGARVDAARGLGMAIPAGLRTEAPMAEIPLRKRQVRLGSDATRLDGKMFLGQLLLAALRRAATRWRSRSIDFCGRDVHVGARCRFWAPQVIRIGDCSYIGKEVSIQTNADVGRYVLIADRVAFVGRHDHEFTSVGVPVRFGRWIGGHDADPQYCAEAVVIEDDVWLGFWLHRLIGVRVGRGAVVAAGSVVVKDVAPYSIVGGVPAETIGQRFDDAMQIAAHEAAVASGKFRFSERGYDHWIVEPGSSE